MELSTNRFLKIEGIKEAARYNLPISKTIFIFDYEKQGEEIDDFTRDRDYVSIRSDSKNGTDFCPHNLKCPAKKAKEFIKDLNLHGYAVILQDYVPWEGNIASGNILILKNHILLELMKEGPLIWLNRDGAIEERIKFLKSNLEEVSHFGKRLIKKKDLMNLLMTIKDIPVYKIIEFTLRPEGLCFWQIVDDKMAKTLENQ